MGLLTLKALLALPLIRVSPLEEYRLCAAPDCSTVYYRTDGQEVFSEADLRELVYQKHRHSSHVLVCYCFQHTVADICGEIERTGTSTIVDRIRAGVRAGQCACDVRNPQGSCCPGNLLELVHELSGKAPPEDAQHA